MIRKELEGVLPDTKITEDFNRATAREKQRDLTEAVHQQQVAAAQQPPAVAVAPVGPVIPDKFFETPEKLNLDDFRTLLCYKARQAPLERRKNDALRAVGGDAHKEKVGTILEVLGGELNLEQKAIFPKAASLF